MSDVPPVGSAVKSFPVTRDAVGVPVRIARAIGDAWLSCSRLRDQLCRIDREDARAELVLAVAAHRVRAAGVEAFARMQHLAQPVRALLRSCDNAPSPSPRECARRCTAWPTGRYIAASPVARLYRKSESVYFDACSRSARAV